MSMLEKGGEAADAVATGLMLQSSRPASPAPAATWRSPAARTGKTQVLCAQGVAEGRGECRYRGPARARSRAGLEACRDRGARRLRPACSTLLADTARSTSRMCSLPPSVRAMAIRCWRAYQAISDIGPFFAQYWPSSARHLDAGRKSADARQPTFQEPGARRTHERILKAKPPRARRGEDQGGGPSWKASSPRRSSASPPGSSSWIPRASRTRA